MDLASIYHDENPYHNFAHAVDVLQCIYYFTCQLGLVPFADGTPRITNSKTYRILRPRDLFALFIAAIGHDTAHPGVNNAFLVSTMYCVPELVLTTSRLIPRLLLLYSIMTTLY